MKRQKTMCFPSTILGQLIPMVLNTLSKFGFISSQLDLIYTFAGSLFELIKLSKQNSIILSRHQDKQKRQDKNKIHQHTIVQTYLATMNIDIKIKVSSDLLSLIVN